MTATTVEQRQAARELAQGALWIVLDRELDKTLTAELLLGQTGWRVGVEQDGDVPYRPDDPRHDLERLAQRGGQYAGGSILRVIHGERCTVAECITCRCIVAARRDARRGVLPDCDRCGEQPRYCECDDEWDAP